MNPKINAKVKPILIFLIIALLFSSCNQIVPDSNHFETETTEERTESESVVTAEPVPDPPEPEAKKYFGIETIDYPNFEYAYGYDMLTENQKTAIGYFDQIVRRMLETEGKENITVQFETPIPYHDVRAARSVYVNNYEVLRRLTASLISEKGEDEIICFYFNTSSNVIADEFEKYSACIEMANEILASLEHDGTEYGKAFAIAKWITHNIVYPKNHKEYEAQGADLRSIYSVLKNREAVCEGYAKIFDFLCRISELKSVYVTGDTTSMEFHGWNMIEINGKWYHVDTTWMCGENFFKNFMMSDDICFANGHLSVSSEYAFYFNENAVPKADSFDLYYYYHGSCQELISYFSKVAIEDDTHYAACFIFDEDFEKFKALCGTEIQNADGNTYYLSFNREATNKYYIEVTFVKKRGV